jgi:alcohol dehydrogenase
MPVKIHLEKNAVKNHAAELSALGSKALIVTGRSSSAKNGSLSDVTDALKSTGISYEIFNEVEANPSVATVMKARDLGVLTACDMVIGVGGGSSLDAAKVISLMMYHKDADESFLFDASAPNTAYPIAAVPTTCGTGSEVTAVSILTLHEQKTKSSTPHKIFPDLALIDGK